MKFFYFLTTLVISFCYYGQIELIQNGSFELGEQGWDFSLSTDAFGDVGNCGASDGDNYLWFGDFDELTGLDLIEDEVSQDVQLPANLDYAEFSFYWSGGSDEQDDINDWDLLYFGIFNANGAEIYYDSISNADMDVTLTAADCDPLWYLEGFTIPSQYAGQTISVVFAAYTDDLNPTLFRVDEVSVLAFTTSSVNELDNASFKISQNPVSDVLTINDINTSNKQYTILDNHGKSLIVQNSNQLETIINVQNLQSGLYFISDDKGNQSKFIKL
jgi:hypothetical protein